MKLLKRILVVFEAFLLSFSLCGCWNYHELETFSIISGIAIDRGENGFQYHLTFECLNMSSSGGGGQGGGGSSAQTILIESDGDTVFEAVRSALQKTDKKLYFSDCKIVVISREIAQEGIRPIIDFMLRDTEPRISVRFLVSQEDTAAEILKQPASPGDIPSFKIAGMMDQSSQNDAACMPMPLFQISTILKTEGQALTIPGIQVVKGPKDPALRINQTAIFGDDRFAGWLSQEQNKYFLFMMDKVKSGLIIASNPKNGNTFTLEILKNKTDIKPQVKDGKVTMKININTEAAFGESSGKDTGEYADDFKTVEQAAEKTVLAGVEKVISSAQNDYGIDFLGFGKKIRLNDFDSWIKIKKDWNRNFKSIKSEITVKVKIENSAVELTKGSK